jgi:hypothetical protein
VCDQTVLVEAVPTTWVDQISNTCRWPTVKGPKLQKLIRDSQSTPSVDWISYPIKILKQCGKEFIIYRLKSHLVTLILSERT